MGVEVRGQEENCFSQRCDDGATHSPYRSVVDRVLGPSLFGIWLCFLPGHLQRRLDALSTGAFSWRKSAGAFVGDVYSSAYAEMDDELQGLLL